MNNILFNFYLNFLIGQFRCTLDTNKYTNDKYLSYIFSTHYQND